MQQLSTAAAQLKGTNKTEAYKLQKLANKVRKLGKITLCYFPLTPLSIGSSDTVMLLHFSNLGFSRTNN